MLGEVADASGATVSAALFMSWKVVVHYHLPGSSRGAARDGANNLLLDTATAWGIERGYESLHLGGGTSDNAGLFRFKAEFGGTLLEFWLARAVLNDAAYDRLAQRRARELSVPRETLAARNFFPRLPLRCTALAVKRTAGWRSKPVFRGRWSDCASAPEREIR